MFHSHLISFLLVFCSTFSNVDLAVFYLNGLSNDFTGQQVIANAVCNDSVSGDLCQNDGVCYVKDSISDEYGGPCRPEFVFHRGLCYTHFRNPFTWCEARLQCFRFNPKAQILTIDPQTYHFSNFQSRKNGMTLVDYWFRNTSQEEIDCMAPNAVRCPLFSKNLKWFDHDNCTQKHVAMCEVIPRDDHMCLCKSPYTGIRCNDKDYDAQNKVFLIHPDTFKCKDTSQLMIVEFAAFRDEKCENATVFQMLTSKLQGYSFGNASIVIEKCPSGIQLRLDCYRALDLYCPMSHSQPIHSKHWFRCFFVVPEKYKWEEFRNVCQSLGGDVAPISAVFDQTTKENVSRVVNTWKDKHGVDFWFIEENGDCALLYWDTNAEPVKQTLTTCYSGIYKGVCSLPPKVRDDITTSKYNHMNELEELANLSEDVIQESDVEDIVHKLKDLLDNLLPSLQPNQSEQAFNLTLDIVNKVLNLDYSEMNSADAKEKAELVSTVIENVEGFGIKAAEALDAGQEMIYIEDNIDIKVFKTKNESDLNFAFSEEGPRIVLSSPLPSREVVGVLYLWKNLDTLPHIDNSSRSSSFHVASVPLGFSINVPSAEWNSQVSITMETTRKTTFNNTICIFFNISNTGESFFDSTGCWLKEVSEKNVTCQCNHTTTFAVLTNYNDVDLSTHAAPLSMISLIGCIISIVALVICLLVTLFTRSSWNLRNAIHANLCFSLLVANITFVIGFRFSFNLVSCYSVAILLHCFFLSAFMWMFLEGIHIFIMFRHTFSISNQKISLYYFPGYGIPVVIVSLTLWFSFASDISYISSLDLCWLNSTNGIIWSFTGPALFILCANIVALIIAVYKCYTYNKAIALKTLEQTRKLALGLLALSPLLGVTWLFGFLFVDRQVIVFAYIFTVLNSLQGLFIFVFHFAMNGQIRTLLRKWNRLHQMHSSSSKKGQKKKQHHHLATEEGEMDLLSRTQ